MIEFRKCRGVAVASTVVIFTPSFVKIRPFVKVFGARQTHGPTEMEKWWYHTLTLTFISTNADQRSIKIDRARGKIDSTYT
jgi:hypothetical protein